MSACRCHADDVLALTRDIKRHSAGAISFANALYAHFGSSSTTGQRLDRHHTLNSHMAYALEDLPAVRSLSLSQVHDPEPAAPPSVAAAIMLARAHRIVGRRLSPMPDPTTLAARAYAQERIDLLERALAMIGNGWQQRTQRTMLRQERRTWRELQRTLEAMGVPLS